VTDEHHPVDKGWAPHARSLAPLVKTRGFGMTPLSRSFVAVWGDLPSRIAGMFEGVIPKFGVLQPSEGSRAECARNLFYQSKTIQVCDERIAPVNKGWAIVHARSLAPLVKTRGFGITPLGVARESYGCVIFSGLTSWSNSSLVRYPSFSAASRRLDCSTCAVCAICAALS
jgi:hypothetical protein